MSECLERARRLAPQIEACAEETERQRQIAEPLVAALHEAGMFRLLLPRALDGAELDPPAYVEVMEEIARHDASTAWSICQTAGCSMVAAYLRPDVARAIFGERDAVLAWGAGAEGRAVAADGGYRVTGTWRFVSGGRHATWFGGHSTIHGPDGRPRPRGGGVPDVRTMLFPATSATMTDVWHVIGLRGTGSDTVSVSDLFVPHEYTVARDEPSERQYAGLLYCFTTTTMYSSGFAGVALGLARSMLEDFKALAGDKTPRGAKSRLCDNAVIQSQVAQCEARLSAARAFLFSSLHEICRAVGDTGALALEQRVRIRLAATHAFQQAREVVDLVYHIAGSAAIFTGTGFERRFRDMHAVSQQLQSRQDHYESVGRFLLGLDPASSFL
jgi:alkylation response protein AidB-like acyl-CoA dehydrogenase